MKAIWSCWYPSNQFVGFHEENLAKSMAVSVALAKIQFHETELITTTYWKDILLNRYGLQFDNVRTDLDQFAETLDIDLWAFIKIFACSLQDKPFVHIDNDLFLYSKLHEEVINSDMFFEVRLNRKRYRRIIALTKDFKLDRTSLESNCKYSYGFGVIGCNNLKAIPDWYRIAHEFIFDPSNQPHWGQLTPHQKHIINQFFELDFLSVLACKSNFSIGLLQESATKFTHLYGNQKNSSSGKDLINKEYFKYVIPRFREVN